MSTFEQMIAAVTRAATERRALLIEQAIRKGTGCRAYTPDPPGSAGGRGIIIMHEWPELTTRQRYADAMLGPFARPRLCYCGEMER